MRNWIVAEAKKLIGPNFEMILGRDLLKHFLLVYEGDTGGFALEFPSITHPLGKEPWVKAKQPIRVGPDKKELRNKKKRIAKMARESRRKNR